MDFRNQIHEGMIVKTEDGHRLGKVSSLEADGFIIEKGLLFKKDRLASFDRVLDIREDEIIYMPLDATRGEESLAEAKTERKMGEKEIRVPVAEEELIAEKERHAAGAVRVHKEVVTENKQVTVPVTREEVRVERVPVEGTRSTAGVELKDQDIEIPLTEEEVRVTKQPVVREEVRVKRTPIQEQRTVSAEAKREEVTVDDEDLKRREEKITEGGMRAPGRDEEP